MIIIEMAHAHCKKRGALIPGGHIQLTEYFSEEALLRGGFSRECGNSNYQNLTPDITVWRTEKSLDKNIYMVYRFGTPEHTTKSNTDIFSNYSRSGHFATLPFQHNCKLCSLFQLVVQP